MCWWLQGAKECPYYMRTGNCKFSTNCRYHHPDPTVAMVGHDPHSGGQSSGSMQQSAFGASTMPVTPSCSQGTLNGPTSFVVASPACSPASNLHSQGFHSNSGCNGYQVIFTVHVLKFIKVSPLCFKSFCLESYHGTSGSWKSNITWKCNIEILLKLQFSYWYSETCLLISMTWILSINTVILKLFRHS